MHTVEAKSMLKASSLFSFSEADLAAYHVFSKDDNPVHQLGVVFGIQLMAKVEGILMTLFELNERRTFSYSFLDKVWVNDTIDLKVGADQHFEVWSCDKKVGEGMIKND
ncbi:MULTISPECIES: hypothetical protein [Pseudolactococcus]|uniref:Uncharacterized protein n=1 Tax=Pseudolactococcus piscium MKFS47 TaxID=297352 RepID=A0A0D6DVG1_9LACT|nr:MULTISPECIES: hypothetical protein [Lactococcus]MCJ1971878.1 hypothetical protein [Lactococcus carnosus]MCJ1991145.1 hypothetical protein [Lactococcus carnosus]CEN27721.1 Uncharacterized protein LACPI_0521 [Lactococcus piscium MKFS47]